MWIHSCSKERPFGQIWQKVLTIIRKFKLQHGGKTAGKFVIQMLRGMNRAPNSQKKYH